MSPTGTTISGGASATSMLTIAFVVLKLCGVIGWSWWWVLSPLWIVWGTLLVVVLVVVAIMALDGW